METMYGFLQNTWQRIFGGGAKKTEVEGHVLVKDVSNKQCLLLVKKGEQCWTTEWHSTDSTVVKSPSESITNAFVCSGDP